MFTLPHPPFASSMLSTRRHRGPDEDIAFLESLLGVSLDVSAPISGTTVAAAAPSPAAAGTSFENVPATEANYIKEDLGADGRSEPTPAALPNFTPLTLAHCPQLNELPPALMVQGDRALAAVDPRSALSSNVLFLYLYQARIPPPLLTKINVSSIFFSLLDLFFF